MTIAYKATSSGWDYGDSDTASVTVSVAPSSGDLIHIYVNRNDEVSMDTPSGFTVGVSEDVPGETANHAVFWKIAGGSEPTTFSVTINTSTDPDWNMVVKTFSSATDCVVDSACVSAETTSASATMQNNAIDGRVLSNNCVSIPTGGMDRSGTGGDDFTSSSDSYGDVLGSELGRNTAVSHRIYTTDGETYSGNVTFGPSTNSDKSYSTHMSFVEGGGGPAANPKGPMGMPLFRPLRGPL